MRSHDIAGRTVRPPLTRQSRTSRRREFATPRPPVRFDSHRVGGTLSVRSREAQVRCLRVDAKRLIRPELAGLLRASRQYLDAIGSRGSGPAFRAHRRTVGTWLVQTLPSPPAAAPGRCATGKSPRPSQLRPGQAPHLLYCRRVAKIKGPASGCSAHRPSNFHQQKTPYAWRDLFNRLHPVLLDDRRGGG
jgi:hypothetical protein